MSGCPHDPACTDLVHAQAAGYGTSEPTASQPPADNELREALAEVAGEHLRRKAYRCSCGWFDDAVPLSTTWEQHAADAALSVVAAHASQKQAAMEARGARSVIGDMLAGGYIDQKTADVFLPALAGES